VLQDVHENRLRTDRNHRFWHGVVDAADPRSLAPAEDDDWSGIYWGHSLDYRTVSWTG
jgi:hypothetical protein